VTAAPGKFASFAVRLCVSALRAFLAALVAFSSSKNSFSANSKAVPISPRSRTARPKRCRSASHSPLNDQHNIGNVHSLLERGSESRQSIHIVHTMPNEVVVQRPHVLPLIIFSSSLSLNIVDMSALNHLILSLSSGGRRRRRTVTALIESGILSKNMRNLGGGGSPTLNPGGIRNMRSAKLPSTYLIFLTPILTFGRSLDRQHTTVLSCCIWRRRVILLNVLFVIVADTTSSGRVDGNM